MSAYIRLPLPQSVSRETNEPLEKLFTVGCSGLSTLNSSPRRLYLSLARLGTGGSAYLTAEDGSFSSIRPENACILQDIKRRCIILSNR